MFYNNFPQSSHFYDAIVLRIVLSLSTDNSIHDHTQAFTFFTTALSMRDVAPSLKISACYVLSVFLTHDSQAQSLCFEVGLFDTLLGLIYDREPKLRMWALIVLGKVCGHSF